VFSDAHIGEMADKTQMGYFIYHNHKWLLVNTNCDSMYVVGDRFVPKGQTVELEVGKQIRLSTAPNGRLVQVQLVQS
jgi:hypothetical protein